MSRDSERSPYSPAGGKYQPVSHTPGEQWHQTYSFGSTLQRDCTEYSRPDKRFAKHDLRPCTLRTARIQECMVCTEQEGQQVQDTKCRVRNAPDHRGTGKVKPRNPRHV